MKATPFSISRIDWVSPFPKPFKSGSAEPDFSFESIEKNASRLSQKKPERLLAQADFWVSDFRRRYPSSPSWMGVGCRA